MLSIQKYILKYFCEAPDTWDVGATPLHLALYVPGNGYK